MSQEIEDFIRKNRTHLDSEEAPMGLWDKIETAYVAHHKSELKQSKVISMNRNHFWLAAASVVILFAVGIAFSTIRMYRMEQILVELNNETLPPQLQDMEAFYNQRYEAILSELSAYPEESEDVKLELSELDGEFQLLKTELGNEYSNEEILQAMIENYRIKLSILERTLNQIKKFENEVEENNDNKAL